METSDPRSDDTGRRRRRRAWTPDTTVPSPCISVCRIDEATGLCAGCLRNLDEIRDWLIMTAEEKRDVLVRLAVRRGGAKSGPGGS